MANQTDLAAGGASFPAFTNPKPSTDAPRARKTCCGGHGAGTSRNLGMSRHRTVLMVVLVFLLGVFIARLPQTFAQVGLFRSMSPAENWGMAEEVRDLLQQAAVDKPKPGVLRDGAIKGMLEALDDQYAEYIPAEDAKEFEKEMSLTFVGIGCQVETRDGWLTVVSPLEDSPALAAGVMAGDRITKIEDTSTFGLTTDACIKLLTGEPATKVNFTIERDGTEIPFTITRARIVSKSVKGLRRSTDSGKWDYLLAPGSKLAYVRMSQFTPSSPQEFADAVNDARAAAGSELSGLIFDLRNNPGGYMESAIRIADMFVEEGKIMSVKGRNDPAVVFTAEDVGEHFRFPVVLLVNEGSASASEIVSGALQDHERAIVLGTRTFGKGLVQSVHALRSDPDAQVKFTTQKYYLPSGRLIQRTDESATWGVDPSPGYFVPLTDQETLDYLLLRRDWDIIRADGRPVREGQDVAPPASDQHWDQADWVRTRAKDKQLAAAVQALTGRVAKGTWEKVSDEPDEHGKIAMHEIESLNKLMDRMGKEFMRVERRIKTLETIASKGKGRTEPPDLWSDKVDPQGGLIEVLDKDGKKLVELRITGKDIERWLASGDVEVVEGSQAFPPAKKPDIATEKTPAVEPKTPSDAPKP